MIQQFTSLHWLKVSLPEHYLPRGVSFIASVVVWLSGILSVHPAHAFSGLSDLPGDSTIVASICSNETYAFNGELLSTSGEYSAAFVASDGTDSIVTLQLTVLPIASASLTAEICQGESYPFNGLALTQSGTYSATLNAENGCDSIVTLTLTVLPNPLTNLSAGICDGTFFLFQGDTLTESGVYSTVLPAANGCDSIVRLKLDVLLFFDVQLEASICTGATYLFDDVALDASGVYTDSLIAAGGCDSIVTLTLTVLPAALTNVSAGICEGSSYLFQGDTLTQSGIFTDTLQAANGCDSLVVLELKVVPFFDVSTQAVICENETYLFGGDTLLLPGVYVDSLIAVGGCDSIVTLTLTVLPVQGSAIEATICQGEPFEYDGAILSDAGVYTFTLNSANGCDSTVTLTLNVLPVANTPVEATICQGETYDFQGDMLTVAGIYAAIFDAENGCDSTVTLTLYVLPVQQTTIEVSICEGELYNYQGDTLTISGDYPYLFTGVNGCDSTVTIALVVNDPQFVEVGVSLCAGEVYVYGGDTLNLPGTYSAVFTGSNGCDSTVTLVLDILPVQQTGLEASICAGTVFEFNGEELTDAGVYTAVLPAENGCDSTIVLSLTVLPSPAASLDAVICAGSFYEYNSDTLTDAGVYTFVYDAANGCDSTVTLHLAVLPVQMTEINASVCTGDSFTYNGETLTESGSYAYIFDGENGCDSLVTLTLDVLPLTGSDLFVTLCDGAMYEFNGDQLTESGIYTAVFSGENGCDSTVTLSLEFLPFFEITLSATICSGASYTFGNDTLTESGDYVLKLFASGGCDSTINLTLTVLPVIETTADVSICSGESYPFNGELLTAPGAYSAVLTGSNGCDSVAVLNLTVLPVQGESLAATICANETYDFNGDLLSTTGVYADVLTGENGCDSTVTLNLTVLPLAAGAFGVVNCNGEPFEYNGVLLTESGAFEFNVPGGSANGCDSLVTVFLTIFPQIPPTETSATICAGETYAFNGLTLSITGTYAVDLASSTGCDSTIILHLAVLPVIETDFDANICPGDSYEFNGETIFVAGTYSAILQSENGCDSTVTLHLGVKSVDVQIELQNGTLTAQAVDANFQWFDCDANLAIPGANDNTFTPLVTGNYAVAVTQDGCADTSACVFVQVVSLDEPLSALNWNIQPNPARHSAALTFTDALREGLQVDIFDSTGRLLRCMQVPSGATRMDVDIRDLPEGMLFLRLENTHGVSTKRLIKADK